MENHKLIAFLAIIFLLSGCGLFNSPQTGWDYIYLEDPVTALTMFQSEYNENPQDVKTVSGLAYTYFLLQEEDSSRIYTEKSAEIDSISKYTIFSSLIYSRFYSIEQTDRWYRKYIETSAVSNIGFYIDSIISNGSMNKIGLSGEFLLEEYDYAYSIMKQISSISDSLDMNLQADKAILWDYISRIAE